MRPTGTLDGQPAGASSTCSSSGRTRSARPEGLAELIGWLAPYQRLWRGSLGALERHLDPMVMRRATVTGTAGATTLTGADSGDEA